MRSRRYDASPKRLKQWVILLLSFGIYGVFVWSYRTDPNEIITLLGILPALVAGWMFGVMAGLLGVPATYLLTFIILTISGHGQWGMLLAYFEGLSPFALFFRVIGMLMLAALIGWGSDHLQNLEAELSRNERLANHLLEREESYRDFIENAPDLFCTHDLSGQVIDINGAAVSMLGYSRDALYSIPISSILLPEKRPLFKAYLRELKTRGEAQGLMAVKTRQGEKRILAYRSTLQKKENDFPIVRVVARDVTKEIHKEREHKAEIAFWEKLSNATRTALKAENLSAMLQVLAEKSVELFEAKNCYIAMWNERANLLAPVAAYGTAKEKFLSEGLNDAQHALAMEALNTGKVLFLKGRDEEKVQDTGICFVLPLITEDEKLGVVIIGYEETCEFDENRLAQVQRAAEQFSMTADKIWLLDKARRRLKELNALHTLSLAISRISDENELLDQLTIILGKTLYPDHFDILMVDKSKTRLIFHSAYKGLSAKRFSMPLKHGITARVIRTGKPELIPDVSKEPEYLAAAKGMRSEVCVPITLRGEVIGVLNAESHQINAFSEEDERLLIAAAEQLSVAIDRLRAEAAQQAWAKRLQRSNDLIRALTHIAAYMETATDPQKVMSLMGMKLKELGLDTAVLLLDSTYQFFQIKYLSFNNKTIARLERLGRIKISEYQVPLDQFAQILNDVRKPSTPYSLTTVSEALENFFHGHSKDLLDRAIQIIGLSPQQKVSYFPLLAQEKFLGYLWLWGDDLKEEDLPALSLFATQAAVAIENARLFLEVERLAVTDELTNINNRRNFFKLAFSEFYRARRYARPLSVLMIDIDHFKKVNDHYGHSVGDSVLQGIAQISKSTLRDLDIIGRYGGEEFVVILSETTLQDATIIAERLRAEIAQSGIQTSKGKLHITVSIGVSGDNVEATNLLEMIECADKAMYAAKRAGRNRVMVAGEKECNAVRV
jgi:diguanylate cyclase (GGDEF)-like protein/PAS domain S-box-containing protein